MRLVLDVVCIENDAANRIFFIHTFHSLVHGLQLDFGDVVGTAINAAGHVEVDGGIETLWSYIEHLSNFLAQ